MANRMISFMKNGLKAIKVRNKEDLKNIYRGNLPLVYAFWFLSIYVLPLELISKYIDYKYLNVPYELVPSSVTCLAMILLVIQTAFAIFCAIATWRSANKYTGRKLWRRLVKFLIVFTWAIYVITFLVGFADGMSEYTVRQQQALKDSSIMNS